MHPVAAVAGLSEQMLVVQRLEVTTGDGEADVG